MPEFLQRLAAGEEGATMIEYALLLSLIAASLVSALTNLSGSMGTKFTSVSNTIKGGSS